MLSYAVGYISPDNKSDSNKIIGILVETEKDIDELLTRYQAQIQEEARNVLKDALPVIFWPDNHYKGNIDSWAYYSVTSIEARCSAGAYAVRKHNPQEPGGRICTIMWRAQND